MKSLSVYAGSSAYAHVAQKGLTPDDVRVLLGASSGPKWLALHGLDKYLINSFLFKRSTPLHLMGTSAGGWRMGCYAQQRPDIAHDRLTEAYIEQCYSKRPSGDEIKQSCANIIEQVLGKNGAQEIIENSQVLLHIITTECHGLAAKQSRALQAVSFLLAGLLNLASRKTLSWQFTRWLVQHPQAQLPIKELHDLPTQLAELKRYNVADVLLSTGCIPVVIEGVKNIQGLASNRHGKFAGVYHDGGITDYSFDLPILPDDGLVLFPHFNTQPVAGWFDKSLKWRKPSKNNYDKTILLTPSDEFVASLPFGKIPDRSDFQKMPDDVRINYWREVCSRSAELADELEGLDWANDVQPLPW